MDHHCGPPSFCTVSSRKIFRRERSHPGTYLDNLSNNNIIVSYRDMKNSGGFNGIRTHDLCEAGAMLYQLNYEASQLGAGHVLHTSSSWDLDMPFFAWHVLCHTGRSGLSPAGGSVG